MNLYMSTVFIAGFLSFFAPCTFPLIPVYIGILTEDVASKKFSMKPIIKTLLFVLGLATTFVTLGFGFGALGNLIQLDGFYIVGGALVVLMGLHQMELIRFKFLEKYKTLKRLPKSKNKYLSTYFLGLTFSFAWTPCVGPVLGAVLVIAAGGGQAAYGGWLMFVYTIGLAIPFVVLALLSSVLLRYFQNVEKYLVPIKRFGGALIVVMGILLMTQNLNKITVWIERLI